MLFMRPNGQLELSQDAVSLKFGTRGHEIDAVTLGHILLSYGFIAQIVNDEYNPGSTLEIKVQATTPGSFIAHLVVLVNQAPPALANLLTANNLKTAGDVVKTVSELIKIKKELKSVPPEEIKKDGKTKDATYIFQNEGSVSIYNAETLNLYMGHPEIPREVARIGSTLEANAEITDFEISDAQAQIQFSANRTEFAMLAEAQSGTDETDPVAREETKSRVLTRRQKLTIVSMSFDDSLIWRFVYMGKKVGAKLTDPAFLKRIDDGEEAFIKGDVLDAELSVSQDWDDASQCYINNNHYEVPIVYQHIPRGKQTKLDFTRDED